MSGEFEPDKFEDRYENAMIELIRSKQAGLPAPKEKAACAACQRRQPDGCAPAQHRRWGWKERAKASSKKTAEAAPKKRAKKAARG